MAKHLAWADAAKIRRHLARHDEQIDDLFEMARSDHRTLELHGRELRLLRELSEIQAKRITHVAASVVRIGRRTRARRARK